MKKIVFNLMLLMISMGMSAQRITRQYNNVSFSAALKDLNARQDKYVINFVYDELEDFKVTKNIKNESVPDAIMNLIGFYPIKMKQVDNVIIVECIQKTSNRMMGRIVDTHHQPVDFANVEFVIPCEVKKAIVKVSCVGYKTYCNAYRTGEVGAITLEDAKINLQKVVIRGHRKYISRENGKLTLDVQNSNLKNIGKATDVIKYILVTPFFYQREVCTAHNKPWGRIRCRNKECHKHHYRTPFLGWTFWYCGCGNLQT